MDAYDFTRDQGDAFTGVLIPGDTHVFPLWIQHARSHSFCCWPAPQQGCEQVCICMLHAPFLLNNVVTVSDVHAIAEWSNAMTCTSLAVNVLPCHCDWIMGNNMLYNEL